MKPTPAEQTAFAAVLKALPAPYGALPWRAATAEDILYARTPEARPMPDGSMGAIHYVRRSDIGDARTRRSRRIFYLGTHPEVLAPYLPACIEAPEAPVVPAPGGAP